MTSQRAFFCAKIVLVVIIISTFARVADHRYNEYNRRSWYREPINGYVSDEDLEAFWEKRGVVITPREYIRETKRGVVIDDVQAYRSNILVQLTFSDRDVKIKPVKLNINDSSVLVMMHIQKTGGTTMENALVLDTNMRPPCECGPMPGLADRLMCTCVNAKGQNWLFNRHAVGWPCGVHPGFQELTDCVDTWYAAQDNEERSRKYTYITLIRDPVSRFISEWLHVRRGATWKECRLLCDGRDATEEEVPFCFRHGTWDDVSFEDFINCESNMAINRQTRMLANLSLSGCYRRQYKNMTWAQRDEVMLQSAKDNLARYFTFFGMLEYQRESQRLLEHTISGLKMKSNFRTGRGAPRTNFLSLSDAHWERVIEKNQLDIRLYQFAKSLFTQRLQRAGIEIESKDNENMFEVVHGNFTYAKFTVLA